MTKSYLFYIKFLSILGSVLAIYLLWEQLFHPSIQPCSINATINCDAIISGVVAKTFGIPTPLIGLVGYIMLFISSQFKRKRIVMIIASLGLLFCLSIAYIELFQLHVICPACILCQLIMISITALSIREYKQTRK